MIHKYIKFGDPKEIRTLDPLIRSQVLYPAELWGQRVIIILFLKNKFKNFKIKCDFICLLIIRYEQ